MQTDIAMVKMLKRSVHWKQPYIVGATILELSKLQMYRMHYDHILPKYGKNAKLMFTDTDSLCYELICENVYSDMMRDLDLYDTSDYPPSHPLHSQKNKKVLGKFKDETNGIPIHAFVGLRSKMYALKLPDDKDKFTCKGISRSYARKNLNFDKYFDCLRKEKETTGSYRCIRSHNHNLRTERIDKIALSCFDDKRYLLKHTFDTLAYGHWRIDKKCFDI